MCCQDILPYMLPIHGIGFVETVNVHLEPKTEKCTGEIYKRYNAFVFSSSYILKLERPFYCRLLLDCRTG